MGELLALHWRDVDFAGSTIRVRAQLRRADALTTPKSGKVRAVPLAPTWPRRSRGWPAVSTGSRRGRPRVRRRDRRLSSTARRLRRRYKAALVRARPAAAPLPRPAAHVRDVYDRRQRTRLAAHAAGVDGPRRHPETTMKYLHYAPREEDARLRGGGRSSSRARADRVGVLE